MTIDDFDKRVKIVQWIIRRNSDGLTKTIEWDCYGELRFIWYYLFDGGNMDCDCNRAMQFESDDFEQDCGDTAYTTVAVIDSNENRYCAADFDRALS